MLLSVPIRVIFALRYLSYADRLTTTQEAASMYGDIDDFCEKPTPAEKLRQNIMLELTVLMEQQQVPPNVERAESIMERFVGLSKGLSKADKETVLQFEKGMLRGDPEAVSKAQEKIEELKKPRENDSPSTTRERQERAARMEKQIKKDLGMAGLKVEFNDGAVAVVVMKGDRPVTKTFYIRGGEVATDRFELGPGMYGGQLGFERDPADKSADDRIGFMKMGRVVANEYIKANIARTSHSETSDPPHGSWNQRRK